MNNSHPVGTDVQPPLFDFQVNGFGGIDFQRDDVTVAEIDKALEALRRCGAGGIFLTLTSETEARLEARFAQFERLRAESARAAEMIWGYHLEGPWLRPESGYCGAHPIDVLCAPSLASFTRLQRAAGGNIRLVTLAPEWPGSAEFIRALVGEGVFVALGHTNASGAEIQAAIRAGARFCTHLGNGVPRNLPRHDNVVQRLLACDELIACFIPDGIHLPTFTLQNFFRAKPADRVLFTTDAMSGAGAGPGRYRNGRLTIEVGSDGVARDPGPSGGFAGSTLTPDAGVKRCAAMLNLGDDRARSYWSTRIIKAFSLESRVGGAAQG